MGEGERLNFGFAGAGEWARKVVDYSKDAAYPLKAYDVKGKEDVELEADYHEQIEDILPAEDFYDDIDVMILSNRVSNHELQFYHAMAHMHENGLVAYEKALSPRYRSHDKLVLNDEVRKAERPDFVPTIHYYKKAAAQKAEELVERYELSDVDSIEVIAQEERMDSPWKISPEEGGAILDFGSHAMELPVVNLDGTFTDNPVKFAKAWDMNSDIEDETLSKYNEAFEASLAIEGDRFGNGAQLKTFVGKNFDQDRKEFLIEGTDDDLGNWKMKGYYGTDDQKPKLEFSTNELYKEWDLSDRKSAKEGVIDELMKVAKGGKNLELTAEKHAEVIRAVDEANQEIDFYTQDIEFDEWAGVPKLDYELLESH